MIVSTKVNVSFETKKKRPISFWDIIGYKMDRARKLNFDISRYQEVIQIKDLQLHFGQYSRNTMKKELQYFVNESLILKTSSGRGVKYHSKGE